MSTGPYVLGPSHAPERPVLRPGRRPWADNDTAVAVVLAGFLMIAAAVSLYGTGGMPDDIQSCPSLAAVDTVRPELRGSCSLWRDDRAHFIRRLGVVGLVVAALGVLTAGRRWWNNGEVRLTTWKTVTWSLLTPVAFLFFLAPTLPAGQANDGVYTALGPVLVAGAVYVTWRAASWSRAASLRAHLLSAATMSVPLVCAGTALAEAYRWRSPSRPFRVQEADFPYGSGGVTPVSILLVVTAVLFAAAVLLARLGRRAPNVWLGGLLFAVSVAVTVPVFVPDLVPAWRNVDATGWDAPGPGVWLPVLLAPAALTLSVWAASALRRDPAAPPRTPRPRSRERASRRVVDAIQRL
ncbi:hypothetical protein ACXR2U_04995 [Jatrophihabitans sp. YIM 134969]